jgi:GTP-binding protein
MTITVAIIGRPNVGKSTLFNRLVGKKLALVDDQPGVTRDRREGEGRLGDLSFRVIDTAGLEEADAASLAGRMQRQTEAAVREADVVLFMMDARSGVMPADRHFADLVRRADKPVVLIANKTEGRAGLTGAYEAYDLGFGDPVPLSAEHGDGYAELFERLAGFMPAPEEDTEGDAGEDGEGRLAQPLRVAIIGRPNAGKSTLINRLVGEDRLLTGPEAGITRDSISIDWQFEGRPLKIFDTAGLRKRANVQDKLEKLANADGLRAVRFAEVAVLLLDATIPFEKQDLTLADLIEREGRAVVIALNKWDLLEQKGSPLQDMREQATRLLPQLKGAPVVAVSAETGQGLDRLMRAVLAVEEVWNRRVSTGQLNRWLEGVLASHPPPAVAGRRIKIRYATQPKTRPPHLALFGNQLNRLPAAYTRYLVNNIRESFDLPGVPIRLSLKTSDNPYGKKR